MEDLRLQPWPAFSNSSPIQKESKARLQAVKSKNSKNPLNTSSDFFPYLSRERELNASQNQENNPCISSSNAALIKTAVAISRNKFQLPQLDQSNSAITSKFRQAKKGFKKLSLDIPVRVSREEMPSATLQKPIFAPEFLMTLGIDRLHGKAVDEEFEDLLRQKGMMPCYESSPPSNPTLSQKKPISNKLLCQHSIIASGSSGIAYEIFASDHTPLLYKIEKHPKLLTSIFHHSYSEEAMKADRTKEAQDWKPVSMNLYHSKTNPSLIQHPSPILTSSVERDKISGLTNPKNPSPAFWRHGDLSSAGLNLPHLVKTSFYFLNVKLSDGREEKFFIPADKMTEFAEHLPSNVEVKLEGQLMEKAPGRTLSQLLSEGVISFNPDDPDGHFYTVVTAVNEFLRAAYAHNFVHRDLKPENILYDPASKTVTIIDTGEASHLGERDNPIETEPSTSTKQRGTRQIMAPSMFEGKEYGAEADFFSAGMLFLKLLNPKDIEKFNEKRFPGTVRDRFFGQDPQKFLSIYLNYLRFGRDEEDDITTKETSPVTLESSSSRSTSSSPMTINSLPVRSTTEEILDTHPSVRRMIELYFQASAAGSPKEQKMSSQALNELEGVVLG